MELVILIGLQAAGKSSFCAHRFERTHEVVSKDRFRSAKRPQARQMKLLHEALEAGKSVVVDNTNATRKDRAELIAAARAHRAAVVGYYFEPKVEESLRHNLGREGKKRVPDIAIYATFKRLEKPGLEEGFDRLFQVRLAPKGGFDVTEWSDQEP
jgi:predicted kinase